MTPAAKHFLQVNDALREKVENLQVGDRWSLCTRCVLEEIHKILVETKDDRPGYETIALMLEDNPFEPSAIP